MKQIKTGLILFAILAASLGAVAQNREPTETKTLVESKNYIFKADYVTPQTGMSRTLTPDYDLTVKPGEVVSYLPYFGRAYSAPINSEGGIKFTSTNFDYKLLKVKKHSWDISIKPKDASDVQEMFLTIFDNGTASLRVNSTNRQTISFRGYVTEGKEEKKA
ncbi:MAG: DUF4251 domain-containing protein, partial [Chitinophagaceae bacterium]